MLYTEAFNKLGYILTDQRQDWSAEKEEGVCISLWKKEMGSKEGSMWMSTKVHATDNAGWRDKLGNQKRIQHLRRALEEFDGIVDVVIVSGTPGVGYGTAQPWVQEGKRSGTRWRVLWLEEDTGHFEVILEKIPS